MERRLVVCQEAADSDENGDDVFCIEDALQSVSRAQWEEFYYDLGLFRPSEGTEIYESMWKHFVVPTLSKGDGSLARSALLYRQLEDRVTEAEPAEIVCDSVERPTDAAVVDDVGREYDVPVRNAEYGGKRRTAFACLTATLGLLPFFVDQLLSLVAAVFVDVPERSETLFVPAVGRFESMRPVIDRAEMEYTVVATPLTAVWYLKSVAPAMRAYDPVPINLFTTPAVLFRQVQYVILELGIQEGLRGRLVSELDEFMRREFDVAMPNAIEQSLRQLYQSNVYRRLLLGLVFESAIERVGAKQVAIGTESVLGRSVLLAARRTGCAGYQIPHSITTEYVAPIQLDRTIFLPSGLPIDYLEERVPQSARKNEDALVKAGRPYLTELKRDVAETSVERSDNSFRILVATQPHDDEIRDAFVENALAAAHLLADALEADVSVVVKTHPSEDPEYYESVTGETDLPVEITDGDLRWNLQASDLVLTVNSNVGLEGIIAGTPCVCINFWNPLLYDLLYAKQAPVPILRSPDEVQSFFRSLTADDVSALRSDQTEFVEEQFVLDGSPARAIASRMESDLENRPRSDSV
ncbi:hypothetical protein [Halomicrobium salinisoli]|uniref:hypothetical protein n=1 Tax=Halomicrobium salinisoli TaxID=2878391 RepID=UPI001CF0AF9C|nr:hypothetical protein [Halomicrobium salinisoli]